MHKRSRFYLSGVSRYIVKIATYSVAASGLLLIASVLAEDIYITNRFHIHVQGFGFDLPLIEGLTLLYLSRLLARRKQIAWTITVVVYLFILIFHTVFLSRHISQMHIGWLYLVRSVVLPIIIVTGLALTRRYFNVKSDIRSFSSSLRFAILVLLITLVYGVTGFQLMDSRDFYQEMTIPTSIHYTIDQFGLTTDKQLTPHTRRARAFIDSLSVISTFSFIYIAVALFQPLKVRFVDQAHNRNRIKQLLEKWPASSEDFFKIWPQDKGYFIGKDDDVALAYHVHRGVALVVGDPAGNPLHYDNLLTEFDELCFVNDWTPAFIHTEPEFNALYKSHNLSLQKIGEEAIVDLEHFNTEVARNKYFRHIQNKFDKAGYSAKYLQPPHSQAIINQLNEINKDWSSRPGREERGFVMGYYSVDYIQQSNLLLAVDNEGVIQAFINQIPSFDKEEANFDLLMHRSTALGNVNDYVLIELMKILPGNDFKRLNLGLCPLVGLDKANNKEERNMVDGALNFAYSNGDRLYSFSGLHRFKAKYEPHWSNRYIAYRGSLVAFTKMATALNKVWQVKQHRLHV